MSGTYRAEWPVTDQDQTMAELQATATGDLPDMLFDASLQQVGPIRWHLRWPTARRTVLVAEFDVEPWADLVRARRRRDRAESGVA